MEVYECVRARRTVRSYRPDPVPGAVVDKLLRAGRWAPSSRNSQPWHFIVVRNRETLRELGAIAASGRFVADAPMAIAIAMYNAERPDLDAGRALQQMELVAWGGGSGNVLRGAARRGPEPAGSRRSWECRTAWSWSPCCPSATGRTPARGGGSGASRCRRSRTAERFGEPYGTG